jgi:hypothetical protein
LSKELIEEAPAVAHKLWFCVFDTSNSNLIGINLFLQSVAIDTEHLGRANLIAQVGAKRLFQQRLFDLLKIDFVKIVQLDLGIPLLGKENLKLTFDQLFKAYGLKVGDKQMI